MSYIKTVFETSPSAAVLKPASHTYDNPAFLRGSSASRSRRSGTSMSRNLPEISPANNPDIGTDDTDLDNESFQSELDQESTHSSLVQQMQLRQYQSLRQISLQQQQNLQAVTRELRHGLQQREGNYRSSTNQWSPTAPQDHPGTEQVEVRVQTSFNRLPSERSRGPPPYSSGSFIDQPQSAARYPKSAPEIQSGRMNPIGKVPHLKFISFDQTTISQSGFSPQRVNKRAPFQPNQKASSRQAPVRPPARQTPTQSVPLHSKPPAKLSTLFGLIDTLKLQSIFGNYPRGEELRTRGHSEQLELNPIPEATDSRRRADGASTQDSSPAKTRELQLERLKANAYRTSNALFSGSITSFIAGILLLISYASPYWLQSWEDTDSPFKNMGLWEFCFYKFRHPDYQFDKLFHGCHALYGDEYRLIREKLLPGWLMAVQLFVTLGLIVSYVGQGVTVALLLRYPLEIILRFERHFCLFALVCNGLTAVLLFLAMCIFGGMCWSRDWLLYPNYNFVSWSYASVVFSALGHIIAALHMFIDLQRAQQYKMQNKAILMLMNPPGFDSLYHVEGSGYI